MTLVKTHFHVTITFLENQETYTAVSYSVDGDAYFTTDMKGNQSLNDYCWRE